jgi:hypothetical protein
MAREPFAVIAIAFRPLGVTVRRTHRAGGTLETDGDRLERCFW